MEFLSGYAAAKAPYLTYEVEGRHSHRKSKPTRSNSTSGAGAKKRSRIPGHARTNSASTSSSGGRTEPLPPHPNAAAPGQQQSTSAAGAGVDVSGAGAEAAVTSDPEHHTTHSHAHAHAHTHRSRRDSTRMSSSHRYYQDKQLPATPRLNTHDVGAGPKHSSEPPSARTPASASAFTVASFSNPGTVIAAVAFPERRAAAQAGAAFPYLEGGKMPGSAGARAESVSSVSGATTTSNRTGEQPASADSLYHHRPFVVRNGRTYLADPSLTYPLPVDLEELHRQSLKTLLLMQLFGRPICAPGFAHKPPPRILEVGCGTGFWSMMCYRYYEARGQAADLSFTGIDIVPLPPSAGPGTSSAAPSPTTTTKTTTATTGDASADTPRPDKDMKWRFVQHDLRKLPLPFSDESFDLVMVKDMALATSMATQQSIIEEYTRVLRPGGTLEMWETDHMLRMLRPHVPDTAAAAAAAAPTSQPPPAPTAEDATDDDDDDDDNDNDNPNTPDDDDEPTPTPNPFSSTTPNTAYPPAGAYALTPNTPLSTPLNNFLVEYNAWVSRACEGRTLCAMPCTVIGPLLIQEAEVLTGMGSRRLAVPLSEIRWEREGVGGVVTKDGKSYVESGNIGGGGGGGGGGKGKGVAVGGGGGGGGVSRGLDPAAAALRRTALLTVVQQIQALEPVLRDVSGKSQDEWDTWLGKMMNDLVRENGTSWGECLEVGAWWARKR